MYSAWHTVDPRKWQVINKVIIPKKERKGLRLGLSDWRGLFLLTGSISCRLPLFHPRSQWNGPRHTNL